MRPLVYVAGPYTNPDPIENVHRAMRAANELWDSGAATPLIPHLTFAWHLHTPRPLAEWYAYDTELLARCDAVWRLPGESTGADEEARYANAHGIPVFGSLADVLTWAAP